MSDSEHETAFLSRAEREIEKREGEEIKRKKDRGEKEKEKRERNERKREKKESVVREGEKREKERKEIFGWKENKAEKKRKGVRTESPNDWEDLKLDQNSTIEDYRKIIGVCPMKFYLYLLYLEKSQNKEIKHKDLSLKNIKDFTGITEKTAKQYLYKLEKFGLIKYKGKIKELNEKEKIWNRIENRYGNNINERIIEEFFGAEIWKERNKKEKYCTYEILKPEFWDKIPKETVEFLSKKMKCSRLEIKIYLWLITYKEEKEKEITFEEIKEELKIKDTSSASSRKIKSALDLLKENGLINFKNAYYYNTHNAKIPSFIIENVNYNIRKED